MNDQEKEGEFRKKHIRLKAMVHGNPPSAVRQPVLFRLLGVDVLPSVIDWLLLSQTPDRADPEQSTDQGNLGILTSGEPRLGKKFVASR